MLPDIRKDFFNFLSFNCVLIVFKCLSNVTHLDTYIVSYLVFP